MAARTKRPGGAPRVYDKRTAQKRKTEQSYRSRRTVFDIVDRFREMMPELYDQVRAEVEAALAAERGPLPGSTNQQEKP